MKGGDNKKGKTLNDGLLPDMEHNQNAGYQALERLNDWACKNSKKGTAIVYWVLLKS